MNAIIAIYEDGVFRPTAPVALPERCEVNLEFHVRGQAGETGQTTEVGGRNNGGGPRPSIEEQLAALAAQVPAAEWDAAFGAARELQQSDYDFDAWQRQREADIHHVRSQPQ